MNFKLFQPKYVLFYLILSQSIPLALAQESEATFDITRMILSVPTITVGADHYQANLHLQENSSPLQFTVTNLIPVMKPPTQFVDTSLGRVLANKDKMTLYVFDKDTPSKSNCNNECLSNWPPLLADSSAHAKGEYSVITRDDSSLQWAYKNRPLYQWINDHQPGDTTGNGIGDVWHVVYDPTPSVQFMQTAIGQVLANKDGMTLYTFDKDLPNKATCGDLEDCAKEWPPFLASPTAQTTGDYSIVSRDNGNLQWAYQNKPLYSWVNDLKPGDAGGDGDDGLWHVVHQVTPPTQFMDTAIGRVLANASSMTLYLFDKDTPSKSNCNDECTQKWPPLLADPFAQAKGDYSVITRNDGSLQWAYQNHPLYLWINDHQAGDTTGNNVGGVWHVIYQ